MTLPERISIDAWTGESVAEGAVTADAARWGARKAGISRSQAVLPFGLPADQRHWWEPDVGYGILLRDPEDPALSDADRAAAVDAEQPVRDLRAKRPGTEILRWSPVPQLQPGYLRRYDDQGAQDSLVGNTQFGVGPNRLPRYILIVGGPDVIPWSVQYDLSVRHFVGRLPLTGDALAHYVAALVEEWAPWPVTRDSPLIWTVDHGGGDITSEMRRTLTDPLFRAMDGTLDGVRHLVDAEATGANLLTALDERAPALVVTSSHGLTGPLNAPTQMVAQLGLPVDASYSAVGVDDLVAHVPAGAIWYAQACCSAGSDGQSQYEGLLDPGSTPSAVVTAIAGAGPTVSPAPLGLLGRTDPVRAVVAHVEPTFDWTLRTPHGQGLGHDVVAALTSNLFADGQPLGMALAGYREAVGVLNTDWTRLRTQLDNGDTEVLDSMTWLRLTALDRQALVLLGDPTVTLP